MNNIKFYLTAFVVLFSFNCHSQIDSLIDKSLIIGKWKFCVHSDLDSIDYSIECYMDESYEFKTNGSYVHYFNHPTAGEITRHGKYNIKNNKLTLKEDMGNGAQIYPNTFLLKKVDNQHLYADFKDVSNPEKAIYLYSKIE